MTNDGYEIITTINRVEKLPVPKGNHPRWRLHTTDGIFLTSPNPVNTSKFVKQKGVDKRRLVIRGERVIDW